MYERNMRAAKSLRKKYEPATIFAAIRSEHFKNIYHLGLKCYGPRGWKYNKLAIEAIKRYDKEFKQLLKASDIAEEQKDKPVEKQEAKQLTSRKKETKFPLRFLARSLPNQLSKLKTSTSVLVISKTDTLLNLM